MAHKHKPTLACACACASLCTLLTVVSVVQVSVYGTGGLSFVAKKAVKVQKSTKAVTLPGEVEDGMNKEVPSTTDAQRMPRLMGRSSSMKAPKTSSIQLISQPDAGTTDKQPRAGSPVPAFDNIKAPKKKAAQRGPIYFMENGNFVQARATSPQFSPSLIFAHPPCVRQRDPSRPGAPHATQAPPTPTELLKGRPPSGAMASSTHRPALHWPYSMLI